MLVIRGRRVVVPDQERSASIHIENGRIVTVAAYDDVPDGAEIVEAGDLIVAPGLVDTHVHVNEPGRTEWEGFDTATRAAAAGVSRHRGHAAEQRACHDHAVRARAEANAARGRCHVDVAFWGGVVRERA